MSCNECHVVPGKKSLVIPRRTFVVPRLVRGTTCRENSIQKKFFLIKILTCFLFFLFSSICFADNEENQFFHSIQDNSIPPSQLVMSLPSPDQVSQNNIWDEIRQHLGLQDQYDRPEVVKWIYWLKSNPKVLNQIFHHSAPYIFYVYQQTLHYHLPAEFALLPMVESGYNPAAYSSTGAVGIWQMMPGTAMIYGLDINWWYDGRRDIITSTDRALTFLLSLHETLGDWLLAAAAYDTGASNIQKAISLQPVNNRSSSFWELSLYKETESYVPKLLAVSAIVANPQKYGITLPYIPNQQYFEAVKLECQLDLAEIAKLAQTDIAEIKRLNPGLRRWATNPDQPYTLLLPFQKVDIFRSSLARIAGQNEITWQYHEVHQGQTLESIASNYHTQAELLRQVNELTESEEVNPGEGLVVPLSLHRKFQIEGPSNVSVAQNTAENSSSQNVDSLTANDVLTGNLQNNNHVNDNNLATNELNSDETDENYSSNQQNNSSNTQASLNTIDIPSQDLVPQDGNSSEPIHSKDSMQTIVNKLYSN